MIGNLKPSDVKIPSLKTQSKFDATRGLASEMDSIAKAGVLSAGIQRTLTVADPKGVEGLGSLNHPPLRKKSSPYLGVSI